MTGTRESDKFLHVTWHFSPRCLEWRRILLPNSWNSLPKKRAIKEVQIQDIPNKTLYESKYLFYVQKCSTWEKALLLNTELMWIWDWTQTSPPEVCLSLSLKDSCRGLMVGKDLAEPGKVKGRTTRDSSKLCSCELWKNIMQVELL